MVSELSTERILAAERAHASGVYPLRDVALVRGEGSRVWDSEGREYLDLAAGHGVASFGHAHPRIAAAVAEQARRLITCPGSFANDRRAELLERLAELTGFERFFLCNSGTEAVEGALKLARVATGRGGVVAAVRGFHGRTFGALSATWEKRYREPFAPLVPGFSHAPYDDLAAMEKAVGRDTACVLIELVQGEGGVRAASKEYVAGLRALCQERGVLLVIDEVQTGFGRTGRNLACEHHDLQPDLLCLGKAIAGGLPMGAVAIGARVGELESGSHGSTFGGNPLACAAALAALDVLREENLAQRADETGRWLLKRMRKIESPLVREVRGIGLMIGMELKQRVNPVLKALIERGVIALPAGPTVLRLLPPLGIEREDLERALVAIEESLPEATRV